MEKTIQILKDRTFNLFNDQWYEQTALEIHSTVSKNEYGYVYFIRIGSGNKCKIGFSNNIIKRINGFKTTLGNNLVLDGFIYCENYKEVEKKIHNELLENKIHGEWFNLNHDSVKKIITEEKGVLSLCIVDNNLLIEDGILISHSSTEINNYKYPNHYFMEKIYSFMRSNSLTIMKTTPRELQEHIFVFDTNYSSKIISRCLKKNGLKSTEKIQRFKSVFTGESIAGNPYIINLPTETN